MRRLPYTICCCKNNGVFELLVWGEQVSGSNNVIVNFGRTHASVKIYDITAGTAPIQALTNVTSVPLTLSDHAVVVELD